MSNARVKLPQDLEKIHLFQLEDCIIQANLGKRDRSMARMYLIDKIPQIEIAAECAERGAQATVDMMAKKGRTRFLKEKSLGYRDAGASSMAIIIRSMSDFLNNM